MPGRSALGVTVLVAVVLAAPDVAGGVSPGAEGPIAFLHSAPRTQGEVWVANPDGSQAGVLARGPSVSPVAWSPDGRRLAYVDGGDLWFANVYDGTRERAIADFRYSSAAAWSPDGSRFAGLNVRGALAVIGIDGTGEVELADPPHTPNGSNRHPDWSPDGSRIVYVRHYGSDQGKGIPEIRVVAPDGSGDQVIASAGFGGEFFTSSWSPDGGQIAVTARGFSDTSFWHLELMAPDGSGRVRIPGSDGAFGAVWSPAGSRLAFVRDGGVWTSGRDGGNAAPLGLTADAGSIVWGAGPRLTHKVAAPADGLAVGVLRGTVRIKRGGARRFTPLRGSASVPFGAQVDARRGTVHIFGGGSGAIVRDGVFRLTRRTGVLAELRLSGRGCKRRLAADAQGRFRVRGRRSAALGEDAKWIVEDRCDGTTRTRVRRGAVQVRDFRRGRTVRVEAGGRYVARR